MHDSEPSLFELGNENASPAIEELLITDQQIAAIRRAFEDAGIVSMEERREIIESCTVRPVSTIRELQARHVRQILNRIDGRRNAKRPAVGSAWDNREEDTWIDKL